MKKTECCNIHSIINGFYEKLYGFIFKKISNKEIAQDIAQDAIVKLIDAYNKNLKIDNPKAWLFKVTRNLIIDYYRERPFLNIPDDELENNLADDNNYEIGLNDLLVPMIKLLPEEYSTPLYLADIEKIKQKEIANKFNLSLSATKMRIQRGRKMLKELFFECYDIDYSPEGKIESYHLKRSCTPLVKEEAKLKKNI